MEFKTCIGNWNDIGNILEIKDMAIAALRDEVNYIEDIFNEEWFDKHIKENGYTIIAYHKQDIVGYATMEYNGAFKKDIEQHLGLSGSNAINLATFAVKPEYQRKGLMKQILTFSERLIPYGYNNVVSLVNAGNKAGWECLLKCGFDNKKLVYSDGKPIYIMFKEMK